MDRAFITTIANKLVTGYWSLLSVGGPILGKELRVSSRHKRYYFLRFAFIMLLTASLGATWYMTIAGKGVGSSVFQMSRMAEVGKRVTVAIVWFQFIAVQIAAIVMLSTAISDEIDRKTLGILMTTPISSSQIVIGKLLSKLLQVVLLLCVSLPLLSIIRVLGGVSWNFVLSSFFVTLTASVFAASISLFFSIHSRQANVVILDTIVVCFIIYVLIPGLLKYLQSRYGFFPGGIARIFPLLSPVKFMVTGTRMMLSPSSAPVFLNWPVQCATMLVGSVAFLALAIPSVRTLALRQAVGEPGLLESVGRKRSKKKKADSSVKSQPIRQVKGSPIIWKEIRRSIAPRSRLKTYIGVTAIAAIIVSAYVIFIYMDWIGRTSAQVGFVVAYMLVGLLQTATFSATSITSEKESRTWPILLTTPLHQTNIVLGKIIGSCLRSWPIWILLFAHLSIFVLIRYVHLFALLLIPMLVAASAIIVSAVGVFLSSLFRRNSVAATVQMIVFLVFCVPVCCPLPTYLINPIVIGGMIMSCTGGVTLARTPLRHLQVNPIRPSVTNDFVGPLLAFIALLTLYLLIAFVCFALASSNVRRKIFRTRSR